MTFVQWLRANDPIYGGMAQDWDDGLTFRQIEALVDDVQALKDAWARYCTSD
jgi:hypothetical protein